MLPKQPMAAVTNALGRLRQAAGRPENAPYTILAALALVSLCARVLLLLR